MEIRLIGALFFFVFSTVVGLRFLSYAQQKDKGRAQWSLLRNLISMVTVSMLLCFLFGASVLLFCFEEFVTIAKSGVSALNVIIAMLVSASVFNWAPSPALILALSRNPDEE